MIFTSPLFFLKKIHLPSKIQEKNSAPPMPSSIHWLPNKKSPTPSEFLFRNHHMIRIGQNGQRSHFLTTKHDQNDSARRDNDSKHIIYGGGRLKI